ncbi:OLC1v1009527C1 [Oldenlandia corymbosa var. corymbosa]|uniref:OLC1v1009527C1 n=1 Tax=Oldenlandia corymbosa var. corymbosa TaxID=529605 RepID=A0AAV1DP64_OLDCO|nr:OLC1v1009527C1 [Oldenlandia corymbosa var. corymbosa]
MLPFFGYDKMYVFFFIFFLALLPATRCNSDHFISNATNDNDKIHATTHYSFFPNKPKWNRPSPIILKYTFLPDHMIPSVSLADMRLIFQRSFGRWAAVIPVTFVETSNVNHSDIKIGFYFGNHGDETVFDGLGGIVAHSYGPPIGLLHLDGDELWVVNQKQPKFGLATDLESVAVHEIGHLLGLAHSTVESAIMYPNESPYTFTRKVDLTKDDIDGIQQLYGANPNFKPGPNSGSSSWSTLMETRKSFGWSMLLGLATVLFF